MDTAVLWYFKDSSLSYFTVKDDQNMHNCKSYHQCSSQILGHCGQKLGHWWGMQSTGNNRLPVSAQPVPENLEWPKLFSHRNVRDVGIIQTLSKDEVTHFSPAVAPGNVCDLLIFRQGCHLGNVCRSYLLQDYLLLSLHTIQRTVDFVLWSKGKISSSQKGWDAIELLCTCENSSSFTKTDQSLSPAP